MFTDNNQFIQTYVIELKGKYGETSSTPKKVAAIQKFLEAIANSPEKYDQLSVLNKEWLHNDFVEIIRNKTTDAESIDELFQILSRIAREVTLRLPYVPKEPEKLFLDYYAFGKEGLDGKEKANSDFLWASLPKYIAMEHLQQVVAERKKTDAAIEGWQQSLAQWNKKIQEHEENLKKYHEHYNFVGLSKAFNGMFKKKVSESRWALFAMVLIGVSLLAPLVLPLSATGHSVMSDLLKGTLDASAIAQIAAFAGLELLLVYFFRIALHNWQSLRTQALQLDLRQSLCAFVEGYSKFARENASQAQNLSKFESLIFSGLISEPGQLPSTYDGLGDIAKLFKELRGKST